MSQENRVVTVTINPAIDHTVAIPNFRAGEVNRVQFSQLDPGGKGINVASFLADWGQLATATGFLGRDNDEIFRKFFTQKDIEDRCVRIAGHTRTGVKIMDEALRQTTDINFPGETPAPADIEDLFGILRELAATREWFVLAGSIPAGVSPGIYREMVTLLAGKKVALDTSGEGFRQAVTAGPWLIKPNVHELEEFVGEPLTSQAAILKVARDLIDRHGISCVIVSMGKDGALFVEGGEIIWAVPPLVEVKSTVGAGDAMVAGAVAGKLAGLPLMECARLATAFSMNTLTHLGSGLSSVEAVQTAKETVTIRELSKTAM